MKSAENHHGDATAALFMALLCWASVPLFLKYFTASLDAWTANACRYVLASLFWMGPLIYWQVRGQVPTRVYWRALIPALANVPGQALWALGPYYLEPAYVAFLTRAALMFNFLIAYVVFADERPLFRARQFWVGMCCCALGIVGLAIARGWPDQATLTGIFISLGCALCWSCYAVSVRHFLRGIAPTVTFPVISLYTCLPLLGFMWLWGRPERLFELSGGDLLILGVSAIVGIALGHVFYYRAIAELGVAITSGVMLLLPFVTAFGSYFIFGERLNGWQWLAGGVLLIGCGLLLRVQARLGPPEAPVATVPSVAGREAE